MAVLFKFSIGKTGCGERFFSLCGRMYRGADQICYKLREGLLNGDVKIDISGSTVSFVYEGVAFNFQEDPAELLRIKEMLKDNSRGKQIEQEEENDFAGFRMVFV